MLGRVLIIGFIFSTALLVVIWHATTPADIGPLGILLVFVLMYTSVLSVLTFLLFGIYRIMSRLLAPLNSNNRKDGLTLTRAYYFSSVLALTPVMFIGMQSVGQVTIYEVLLLGIFTVIAYVYVLRRTS